MTRYLLIIILLIIYYVVRNSKYCNTIKQLNLIRAFSLVLIFDSGLRNLAVGPDTYQYFMRFETVKTDTLSNLFDDWLDIYTITKDPFYSLFQKLFQYLFPHYRLFLFFVAILFFSALGQYIYNNVLSLKKIVVSYVLYLSLFYGFFSVTGIRQTIAVSLTIFAYSLLQKKKIFFALLLTLLASQFHSSALIFLLAFAVNIVSIKKIKRIIIPLTIFLIFVVYTFRDYFALYVVTSLGGEQFSMYVQNDNQRFSLIVFLMYAVVLGMVLLKWKMFSSDEKMMRNALMYIIGFLLMSTAFIDNNAIRITLYYTFSLYFLVPEIVSSLRIKHKYALTVLVFCTAMYFSVRDAEYRFYWQDMKLEETGRMFKEEKFLD